MIGQVFSARLMQALVAAGLSAALLSATLGQGGDPPTAGAQDESNAMAVDAIPGGTMDTHVAVPGGGTFDIDILITSARTEYQGYSSVVVFDPALVAADAHSYLAESEFTFCAAAALGVDMISSGCIHDAVVGFTGATDRITFRCIAEGTSQLHLVGPAEADAFTTTLAQGGPPIATTLTDASVTCGEGGGPMPTATPPGSTPTPTPEGVGPTPTPTGPMPTATPLPPDWEAVHLAAGGCQFEAWTGADATEPAELSGLVGPAGNLRSLWAQQPVPTWRGYSPEFPDVSDMGAVDQLDVLAICTTGPGDFARPIV